MVNFFSILASVLVSAWWLQMFAGLNARKSTNGFAELVHDSSKVLSMYPLVNVDITDGYNEIEELAFSSGTDSYRISTAGQITFEANSSLILKQTQGKCRTGPDWGSSDFLLSRVKGWYNCTLLPACPKENPGPICYDEKTKQTLFLEKKLSFDDTLGQTLYFGSSTFQLVFSRPKTEVHTKDRKLSINLHNFKTLSNPEAAVDGSLLHSVLESQGLRLEGNNLFLDSVKAQFLEIVMNPNDSGVNNFTICTKNMPKAAEMSNILINKSAAQELLCRKATNSDESSDEIVAFHFVKKLEAKFDLTDSVAKSISWTPTPDHVATKTAGHDDYKSSYVLATLFYGSEDDTLPRSYFTILVPMWRDDGKFIAYWDDVRGDEKHLFQPIWKGGTEFGQSLASGDTSEPPPAQPASPPTMPESRHHSESDGTKHAEQEISPMYSSETNTQILHGDGDTDPHKVNGHHSSDENTVPATPAVPNAPNDQDDLINDEWLC